MANPQITVALHTITQRDAAHVLGVMGLEGGTQPGTFTEKLIEAMLVADIGNQERLARGFEGLMSAVQAYKYVKGGVKMLQDIEAGRPHES